jgi:hypothetical protein
MKANAERPKSAAPANIMALVEVAATVAFSAPRRISMGSGELPAAPFTIICRVRRAAISGASMATFCISFASLDRDRMDALFMLAAPIQ